MSLRRKGGREGRGRWIEIRKRYIQYIHIRSGGGYVLKLVDIAILIRKAV